MRPAIPQDQGITSIEDLIMSHSVPREEKGTDTGSPRNKFTDKVLKEKTKIRILYRFSLDRDQPVSGRSRANYGILE